MYVVLQSTHKSHIPKLKAKETVANKKCKNCKTNDSVLKIDMSGGGPKSSIQNKPEYLTLNPFLEIDCFSSVL